MTSLIDIRPLTDLRDLRAAIHLQQVYWGSDAESVVPAHMLLTIVQTGGHVLAAFDGDRMVGVLIGLVAFDGGPKDISEGQRPYIASKRMVVLPEFRGGGIGYQLKLKQRDLALAQHIQRVVWTFDPLLAPNAHLNLHKLGAVCPAFYVDYYGADAGGGLSTLGTSDRLLVEWPIAASRTLQTISGTQRRTLDDYLNGGAVHINPVLTEGSWLASAETFVSHTQADFGLIEIPVDFQAMVKENEALARRWQRHIRAVFSLWIGQQNNTVIDFVRARIDGQERGFYIVAHPDKHGG
jgi:predicted GNAT superfamily acetyltransferase